jgi:hypothetical protein
MQRVGLGVDFALVVGPGCEIGELKSLESCRGKSVVPFLLGNEFVHGPADNSVQGVLVFRGWCNPKDEFILPGVHIADMAGKYLGFVPLKRFTSAFIFDGGFVRLRIDQDQVGPYSAGAALVGGKILAAMAVRVKNKLPPCWFGENADSLYVEVMQQEAGTDFRRIEDGLIEFLAVLECAFLAGVSDTPKGDFAS